MNLHGIGICGGSLHLLFPLLLVIAVLAITILIVCLIRTRHRLHKTQECLVRYINICVELSELIPTEQRPLTPSMKDHISRDEFTHIISRMLKRLTLVPFFFLLAMPVSAKEKVNEAVNDTAIDSWGEYISFGVMVIVILYFIIYGKNIIKGFKELDEHGAELRQYIMEKDAEEAHQKAVKKAQKRKEKELKKQLRNENKNQSNH